VFFDPDVYPMNWAWWDGKMPVEHYRHEHGLDAEGLAEGQEKAAPGKAGEPGEDIPAK
jgi:hypothetical protein